MRHTIIMIVRTRDIITLQGSHRTQETSRAFTIAEAAANDADRPNFAVSWLESCFPPLRRGGGGGGNTAG